MRSKAPIIAGLLAVALAVGFWYLLYQPKVEEREEIEAETAELENRASQLRSEIAYLREIEANVLEYEAKLARLDDYIPRDVNQPAALRQFQSAADEAGVEIDNVSFGNPVRVEDAPDTGEPDTTLASIDISMTLAGGYFQLVDWMRRLEVEVNRALLVDSVNLSESGDGFPELSGSWSGQMFAVVDVAAAGEPGEGDAPDPDDPDGEGEDAEDGEDDVEGDDLDGIDEDGEVAQP